MCLLFDLVKAMSQQLRRYHVGTVYREVREAMYSRWMLRSICYGNNNGDMAIKVYAVSVVLARGTQLRAVCTIPAASSAFRCHTHTSEGQGRVLQAEH